VQVSSVRSDSTATEGQQATAAITLSERSLLLLALVRIFFGLLWLQQLSWKMPPTFGGLRSYIEKEVHYTFVPGYSFILKNVFLAHFSLLGTGVWGAELLVGLLLLFGLFTRFGALLAIVLSTQLYIGLAYAPGEWYWTYGMLILLGLALAAVPAGRRMGIDQLLISPLHHAAHSNRLARLASWFV
jgi:uncharacterized membrane protein YphA (DoxX/SURF4 family)